MRLVSAPSAEKRAGGEKKKKQNKPINILKIYESTKKKKKRKRGKFVQKENCVAFHALYIYTNTF